MYGPGVKDQIQILYDFNAIIVLCNWFIFETLIVKGIKLLVHVWHWDKGQGK